MFSKSKFALIKILSQNQICSHHVDFVHSGQTIENRSIVMRPVHCGQIIEKSKHPSMANKRLETQSMAAPQKLQLLSKSPKSFSNRPKMCFYVIGTSSSWLILTLFHARKDLEILASRPCHVGNTISRSNTEVKQHWAWIVLGWVTAWELQVLLTKTRAWLCCRSM